ncbi:class I SAM-dependent methyltransferase [Candidatus Babeliales bacterium]|nr:class I SAM-dependent methyltransferase [Candidatus Babeliales bacterium]
MDYRDYQAGASHEHFWFKAKPQFIRTLLEKIPQKLSQTILDIGAGTGEDVATLARFGNIYAVDIDQQALDMIPDSLVVEKKQADACALPYENATFDVVVAFDVLEHVEHDQKMVDEIFRVLKPGGYFVFTVPAYNMLFSAHDRELLHFRRYTKSSVHKLFRKFTKLDAGYWFFLLFAPAALKRLMSKNNPTSGMAMLPPLLNSLCFSLLRFENWLLSKGLHFPCGLSVYGIYQKRN